MLLCYTASHAQPVIIPAQKQVYKHQVFWSKIEGHEFFNNSAWGIGADLVLRYRSTVGDNSPFSIRNRLGIRPWINYQPHDNFRVSLSPIGYMETNEYMAKPEDLNRPPYHEWRTTFQLFHHHYSFNKRLMHTFRHRYELRWQERPGNLDDPYRFFTRYRIRYRARVMLNYKKFYDDGVVYGMISNEIGLNIGKNVVMNTFNQNRFYVGAGYRFGNALRAELRYVNRFRTRGATGFEFDLARGPMVAFYIDKISKVSFREDRLPPVRYYD
ncbi:MAG TPA: DUF2490 domain-containing protein [Phnomibacter sp.]|nr:DUF2490 domain-containing protein [Phnomibacter sp.]